TRPGLYSGRPRGSSVPSPEGDCNKAPGESSSPGERGAGRGVPYYNNRKSPRADRHAAPSYDGAPMRRLPSRTLILLAALAGGARPAGGEPVAFNRGVRPLLPRFCSKRHGPDDRAGKAKMRLARREAATAEARSGLRPIVPGSPDKSELVRRIFSAEPTEVM